MKLSDVPVSQPVIIDANILVYAYNSASPQCAAFVERCAAGEVSAVIPATALAETMHVLMLNEAKREGIISGGYPAKHLSLHPEKVRSLRNYESAIRDLLATEIYIEELQKQDFSAALLFQRQYGLLTNDALFVAVAERLRVGIAATADLKFRNIKEFEICYPDDLD